MDYHGCRYAEADRVHTDALKLLRRTTESIERADHCAELANLRQMQARFAEAHKLLEQAREESEHEESELCDIRYQEALLDLSEGKPDAALSTLASLAEACEDEYVQLEALNKLGWHGMHQGSYEAAKSWFEKAIAMSGSFSEGCVRLQMAVSHAGVAAACLHLHSDAPAHHEEEATALLQEFPFQQADGVQVAMYCLATCKMLRGLKSEANDLFAKAAEVQCNIYAANHPANAVYQTSLTHHIVAVTSAAGSAQDHSKQQGPVSHSYSIVANAASMPPVDE